METIVSELVTQITGGITTDVMTVIVALLGIGLIMLGFRLIKHVLRGNDDDVILSSEQWDGMDDVEREDYLDSHWGPR